MVRRVVSRLAITLLLGLQRKPLRRKGGDLGPITLSCDTVLKPNRRRTVPQNDCHLVLELRSEAVWLHLP